MTNDKCQKINDKCLPVIRVCSIGFISLALMLLFGGCQHRESAETSTSRQQVATEPTSMAVSNGATTSMVAVRFLEDRVKNDPDDLVALNKLSSYYLQLFREKADPTYLTLALKAARESLRVVPAEENIEGLFSLAQTQFQTHDFVSARDNARKLIALRSTKSCGYQVLGDASLELGDYDQAGQAYSKMEELDRGSVATETRLARLAVLRGDLNTGRKRYELALSQAQTTFEGSSESIAWCQWQLGDLAFNEGDYKTAEQRYRDSLTTLPGYFRGLASLGRVRAANGDLKGAIELYEHAVSIIPDPQFVAALGDLYKLVGRTREASAQYQLVEKIARLNELNGSLYSRQLANFLADHDIKADEAYANASKESVVRHDVFGSDALAWTALKAGKIEAAQSAIKDALRLGTRDARLFYHAGMIARAAGDANGARAFLKHALDLNPQFDPVQSQIARKALEQ
jgi:tetratricopeptide (TPR) repeat protein